MDSGHTCYLPKSRCYVQDCRRRNYYNLLMAALMYALITLGNALLTGVMSGWLLYFYLPPSGWPLVPTELFGLVVLFSRVVYILSSVSIDGLVRRTHSSWGAHLPYVLGGALCMPFLFMLLWSPPYAGSSFWNLCYLLLALTGFNLAAGFHQIPYEGLLAELDIEDKERQSISNWRMLYLLAGNLLAGLAGPLIEAFGYAPAMWIFVACAAPCLILPGLFLRRSVKPNLQSGKRAPFLENIRTAWRKPAFRIFTISWGLMWLATTLTFETLPYIVTEILHLSKAQTAYFYFSAMLVPLLAYPVVMRLSERYGTKAVFRGSLLAGAASMSLLILVGENIPVPLFVQGLLWIILQAVSLAGAQALPGTITGEIGEPDQSTFGNLVDQLASGLALAIIPFFLLLGHGQFDPAGAFGIRLLGPTGGLILLLACLIFGRYKVKQPIKT